MTIDERRGPIRPFRQNGSKRSAAIEVSSASEEGAQFNQIAFLTTEQVAIATGLSPSYWEKLRVAGGGPFYSKCGSCVRYHPRDIAEFMATRRQSSTSQNGEFARPLLPESNAPCEW